MEAWRVQDGRKINNRRERLALRNKVKEETHLIKEIYGGSRDDIGMKTCLHGPMDYARKLKLRFRLRDLNLPERERDIPVSREEDMDAHMCPCGTTIIESRM